MITEPAVNTRYPYQVFYVVLPYTLLNTKPFYHRNIKPTTFVVPHSSSPLL